MIGEGVTLSTYIDLLNNHSSSYSACYVNLQEKVCNHGVFQMGIVRNMAACRQMLPLRQVALAKTADSRHICRQL